MNIGQTIYQATDEPGHIHVRVGRVVAYDHNTASVLVGDSLHFWPREKCFYSREAAVRAFITVTPTPSDLRELDATQ